MIRAALALLRATLIALFLIFACYSQRAALEHQKARALCGTDTECMALCPADDKECDGGPQS